MADFEVCYFCGRAPDGALGEYAVVPRAFDPGPDEQHSVVLCSTCRDKLTALMKPVVEAAPNTDPAPSTDPASSTDPAPGPGSGDDPSEDGITVESGDESSEPRALDEPSESDTPDESTSEAPGEPEGPSRSGPSRSGPPRDPRRAAHQDILGDDSETYNRVLRLLRNREFPVQRDDIEEVAATAYELEPSKVSSAIDTMVQKGLLVDQDGTLRRG